MGFWGGEGPILPLIEPNGPETILWGHCDPPRPCYIIPTNSQVPGTGVPNLYFPEVSPWAESLVTQHTRNGVESLYWAGKILMPFLPGNSSPFFRQEESRMSSGCIQGHICCKDKWTIMFLGSVSVGLGQRVLTLWGLLWPWVDQLTSTQHSSRLSHKEQGPSWIIAYSPVLNSSFLQSTRNKCMRTYHLKNTAACLSKILWV